MAKCKYCEEPIEWIRDEENERWIPKDPNTGDRHECKEGEEEKANEAFEREVPACNYCHKEISFKQITVDHDDESDSAESKWVPYEVDGSKPHQCRERKQAWIAEQAQRTGRSEAQLCRNGCRVLVFWNYDVRSKLNKKPLPYEQATNTYHKCPKYNPAMRRR